MMSDDISANERAFMALVAHSEGTDRAPDPYRVCYSFKHTIVSFKDHPAITGEWMGETLPDDMCRAAGFSPGCRSTAAGRYQIKRSTWLGCKRALLLPDFSPASQDQAALLLIHQHGATEAVQAGRIAEAVDLCRREWASLPASGWKQHENPLDVLIAAYTKAGGTLA